MLEDSAVVWQDFAVSGLQRVYPESTVSDVFESMQDMLIRWLESAVKSFCSIPVGI